MGEHKRWSNIKGKRDRPRTDQPVEGCQLKIGKEYCGVAPFTLVKVNPDSAPVRVCREHLAWLPKDTVKSPHNPSEGFDERLDRSRLTTQTDRVFKVMSDHGWHTLADISSALGGAPEASISADLRLFRRSDWGAYRVDSERIDGGGIRRYRMGEKGTHVPRKRPCKRCTESAARIADLEAQLEALKNKRKKNS